MGIFKSKTEKKKHIVPFIFADDYLPAITWRAGGSVGKLRDHNEDAIFGLNATTLASEAHYSFGLFMVADGMGGHLNGEVASNLAIQAASATLYQQVLEPLRLGQRNFSSEEINAALESAVKTAQNSVLRQVSGGGTTLTIALVLNQKLYFTHVGDSRLYIAKADEPLRTLTKDHSLVRRLVELGQVTEEEAAEHPQRNVLFRAIGQEEGFKTDFGEMGLASPHTLLLCTDGLWGLVDDKEIDRMVRESSDLGDAVNALIDAANQAGGSDNISVILVKVC
ncbi:MAG: PP2C family protein-serine/threonine phosphatase [Anaerolineaceae bacterium]|jgi:serine/threonine protein phosphatase PrpC